MAQIGIVGLQGRLLIIIVLGTILYSIVAGVMAYHLGQKNAVNSSVATLNNLALAVEKTLAIGTYASDPILLNEVVNGLARSTMVSLVEIRSLQDEILARAPKTAIHPTATSDNLHIVKPLFSPFDSDEQIGILHIYAQQTQIASAARQEAKMLTIMMIGQATLIATLLYAVVNWLISRPITKLATKLRSISPGTDERLYSPPLHQYDEIGMLITSANILLETNAVALKRERELREEIALLGEQYRQIFDSSSAGIFVLNEKGELINSNPTVAKVTGLTPFELLSLKQSDFIDKVFRYPDKVRAMQQQAKQLNDTVSSDIELPPVNNQRRWVHCLISVHSVSWQTNTNRQTITEGVIYDITERKSTEKAVHFQANHDSLTGLKNRAACHFAINQLLNKSKIDNTPISLLCIDLDGFKSINDNYGHDAGDKVLITCAKRMSMVVRHSTDIVGRLGGDEFLILLYGIDAMDSALNATANTILSSLSQPIKIKHDLQVRVGASIGIACAPLHSDEKDTLLAMADASMYEVKRTGKNTFSMAMPTIFHTIESV